MNEMPHANISTPADTVPRVFSPVYDPFAKPTRHFTTTECVFAWLSLAAGYGFCRAFPVGDHPLGGFLLVLALFLTTAIVLKLKGTTVRPLSVTVAVSAMAVSASLILSANEFLHFFAYAYALAAYGYYLYAATGNALKNGFSDLLAVDFLKALLVMPFYSFDQLFKAMFSGKAKGSGKVLGKLLLGIALAVVPTTIVLTLLSYDSDFANLLARIFDFSVGDIFYHMVSLGFAIPIGMYVFGMFVSSVDNQCRNTITADSCRRVSQKMKIAPTITVLAAVLPLLFVYVVFFISQWKYYVSGFTGVLPAAFSYAEYAREGFFQLCAVSVINLIVIVLVMLFMRRPSEHPPVLLKLLVVVFSVFTLVLISTALAKMVMYIDFYGLTPKRVYATWLMVVLAVVFLLVALRQFVPKLQAVAASLAVCVVFFAALSLSNVDSLIAWYNVERYLDGTLETVDMAAMDELGDAAIPELVRLEEVLDQTGITDENRELYNRLANTLLAEADRIRERDTGIFSFTVPAIKAESALHDAGWLE